MSGLKAVQRLKCQINGLLAATRKHCFEHSIHKIIPVCQLKHNGVDYIYQGIYAQMPGKPFQKH